MVQKGAGLASSEGSRNEKSALECRHHENHEAD